MTGAESVHGNPFDLYTGLDDPRIDADLAPLVALAERFHTNHAGKALSARLGVAAPG